MLSNRLMRRVLRFPGERLDKGQPSNSHEGHLSSKSRKEDDRDDSRPVRRYPNSNISGKTRTDGSTKDRKSESTELAGILREENCQNLSYPELKEWNLKERALNSM